MMDHRLTIGFHMHKKILVVIVTHNSSKYFSWALEPLLHNAECQVRIVDSGSSDTAYLKALSRENEEIDVIFENNIGFAKANNRGLYDIINYDFVLFLNPDARVEKHVLSVMLERIYEKKYSNVGIFSVPLIQYNFDEGKKSNNYDSLGIYCDYLGRWKDIRCEINSTSLVKYEAICGAFMLCRVSALMQLKDSSGNIGFEESFFMYKEDIELSLRIKSKWQILIFNDLFAYHCRGWGGERKKNPYWSRLISAKNDMKIAFKFKKRALPFSILKYLYVILIERKGGGE